MFANRTLCCFKLREIVKAASRLLEVKISFLLSSCSYIFLDAIHFSFVLGCCGLRWLFLSRQTEKLLVLKQMWWDQARGQFFQDLGGFHKKTLSASYSVRNLTFLSVRASAGH